MSHIRIKTKYNVEGDYGSVKEKTLYAHHNLSCDVVTFYDENGKYILSVEDTMDNNLLDALNKLYGNTENQENIEFMSQEDCKLCGI